ncbi:MAG: hypothetical protein Q9160_006497 [Pyrenula sp. 1 TL-2023]
MATGGIALLLASQPYSFRGLPTIAVTVYIFNLILFVSISAMITVRFVRVEGALVRSLQHPVESLFFPTFWLSLATIITGMERFGAPSSGPWLTHTIRVLFWIYLVCTYLVSIVQYWSLFAAQNHPIHDMSLAWLLPIFPIMLTGVVASVASGGQQDHHSIPIIVAGVSFQGLGMLVSILMYAVYVRRLMQFGLPEPSVRPGMFIAVGPPSFTALAFLDNAKNLPMNAKYISDSNATYEALNVTAAFNAILLWSVGLWFFGIALLSVLAGIRKMNTFHLGWWAMVFPNVGFALATIKLGQVFENDAVKGVGSGMTITLIVTYVFVLIRQILALVRKEIMFENKGNGS